MTDERILVLMPTSKDSERMSRALTEAGLSAFVCKDMDELCLEIARGAGMAMLTEEAVAADRDSCLHAVLRDQPPWSDFPLVVLAREGEGRGPRIRESMNATLVERPVRIRSLLSVVRAAMRSRRHQYAVRDHLEERARAAEAIRRERERYRVTLSSIGDAVIATDAGGRISFMNGVAEALTGWAPSEAAGRPLPDVFRIVNELTREPAENPALRALREGTVVGLANHTVLIARDVTERPIDDSAAPIRDGEEGPTGAVLVFRDVTERRRAEEARARLAAIVESSDDAIVSKSLDGTILSWNAGAERLFGHTAAEAVGQSITLIIPPDRLDEERDILDRLRRGERLEHFETVRVSKDGRLIDISLTVSPVRNRDGQAVGASKVARDITQRKRAEAALRESEGRFRALVTATSDAVYRMSPDWTEMRNLDGREFIADTDVPIPSWLEKYIPAEDQPRVTAAIADAIRGRKAFELEHRVLRVDRTVGWTFSRAIPILGPDGEITEWFGAASDVTRRKQAEEDLARVTAESGRRKRLYETILSATPDFVYVFSLDYRILYANASLVAMWGAGDPVGKTFLEIGYEPWHAEMHCREIDQVRSTKQPVRGEVPFTGSDGRRIYDYIFVPVIDARGEVEAVAGTTRDVTARKQVEERLQLAVDIARMGTFEIDLLTDAVEVNEPGREIYGWASARTTFARVQTHFHPDDRDEVMRQVGAAFDPEGPGVFEVEQRIVRADGAVRWIRVRGRAFFIGEGADRNAVRCVGTYLDVTDRKEAEEELREADRRKDEFLATLAHELRNPLAPIRNGLQVIRLAGIDHETACEALAVMERQLGHMVRLIDDLLDVSRISRNKMELRRARVALSEVVASAVETARPLIDEASHELTVSLPVAPVHLDADLTRLAQVFSNLLTNSAKYTPRGGRVWLSAERSNGAVVVTVRDNGIGIPAAALPNIFDMFSQVDRSVERSTGGLGIGLALVKGLVEMHGGTVAAASEGEGRGSSFTVTLPALAERPGSVDAGPSEAAWASAGPGRRILVADDYRDGADSLAMMLRLLGNEVRTANDGVAAVAEAERFRPELILMDVGMPRLNGLDVTRRIREQEWGRDIAIVALTGWGQEGDRERSRAAGCDGHLVKPVAPAALERLLVGLRKG